MKGSGMIEEFDRVYSSSPPGIKATLLLPLSQCCHGEAPRELCGGLQLLAAQWLRRVGLRTHSLQHSLFNYSIIAA